MFLPNMAGMRLVCPHVGCCCWRVQAVSGDPVFAKTTKVRKWVGSYTGEQLWASAQTVQHLVTGPDCQDPLLATKAPEHRSQ